ncbi:hypothetical protein G20c_43 [Thermus phage G20c]|nr:hypothetical protein G20c_43 [Thermus phage G20c]
MINIDGVFKGYELKYTDNGTPILDIFIGSKNEETPVPIRFMGGPAVPYLDLMDQIPVNQPVFANATLGLRAFNNRTFINLEGINFGIVHGPGDFSVRGLMMAQVLEVKEMQSKRGRAFKVAVLQPYLNSRQDLAPTVEMNVDNITAPGLYTISFTVRARSYNDKVYLSLQEVFSQPIAVAAELPEEEAVPF